MATGKKKRELAKAPLGTERRAGALLDAELYNMLVEFALRMDVDLSWVVRHAFREFAQRHSAQLEADPQQLAFDLGFRKT